MLVLAVRPRQLFRVTTRTRSGYDGATLYDVQLVVSASGAMVWAQTFTDPAQAEQLLETLERDLDTLDVETFRRRYTVPATS